MSRNQCKVMAKLKCACRTNLPCLEVFGGYIHTYKFNEAVEDGVILDLLYNELLKPIEAKPGKGKTETYEEQAKSLFIKEPANMKLLVVLDKLLTGFDAPPCTYLYIDKSMQDHGLFQSICRTNRLDGDDKDLG